VEELYMGEEFFIYHFEGGMGLSGAFSSVAESGEAGLSQEYGYLVNDEEIPALEDHLVHIAELEEELRPVREVSGDTYSVLRQAPDEVVSEVSSEFDLGRVKDYDLQNILRTPAEGYAPGDAIARGVNADKELRKTARRGYVEGHRETVKNSRAKDNTTTQVDFYTNSLEENEIQEVEEFIQDLQ
jgi:hypothetical protein